MSLPEILDGGVSAAYILEYDKATGAIKYHPYGSPEAERILVNQLHCGQQAIAKLKRTSGTDQTA